MLSCNDSIRLSDEEKLYLERLTGLSLAHVKSASALLSLVRNLQSNALSTSDIITAGLFASEVNKLFTKRKLPLASPLDNLPLKNSLP